VGENEKNSSKGAERLDMGKGIDKTGATVWERIDMT
jgi:hypothetical protein